MFCTTTESFSLTVDRERSRSEMVAAGNYAYPIPGLTEENFPVEEGDSEVESVLLDLDRAASNEEVLAGMERMALRPATMDELCAFGEQHPDLQRDEYPIMALGSVWTDKCGYRSVGFLWESAGHRYLDLDCILGVWPGSCRFLVVRM